MPRTWPKRSSGPPRSPAPPTARSRCDRSRTTPRTTPLLGEMTPDGPAVEAIERVFREESGLVTASLIRVLGDFDAAEEAVQDAFLVAVERWPRTGVPPNPGAWISTTARNKAIDRIRRARVLAQKADQVRALAELRTADEVND